MAENLCFGYIKDVAEIMLQFLRAEQCFLILVTSTLEPRAPETKDKELRYLKLIAIILSQWLLEHIRLEDPAEPFSNQYW